LPTWLTLGFSSSSKLLEWVTSQLHHRPHLWMNVFFERKQWTRFARCVSKKKPSERSAKENTLAILWTEFVFYRVVLE